MKLTFLIASISLITFSSCKKDSSSQTRCYHCVSSYDGADKGTKCGTFDYIKSLHDADGSNWNCIPIE